MGGRGCGDGFGRGRAGGGAAVDRGEAVAADGGVVGCLVAGGRGRAFGRGWRRGGGRAGGGVAADVDGPAAAAAAADGGRPVALLAGRNYANATGKDRPGWDPGIREDRCVFPLPVLGEKEIGLWV